METLQTTLGLIKDMADEEGLDLDNIEQTEEKEAEKIVHILLPLTRRYGDMVDDWMNKKGQGLDQALETLDTNSSGKGMGSGPGMDSPLKDIIEVIRWYQYQIHVKLMRAIKSRKQEEEYSIDAFSRDSNGSVKVALIGLDRSISAWTGLVEYLPKEAQDSRRMVGCLSRLRNMVEKEFPQARSFIRPGFDEGGIRYSE
jgi:hypothetical protein